MLQWYESIQSLVDEIDRCIYNGWNAELTLKALSGKLGYSEYYISRRFREIAGMPLRQYLRQRQLTFALKALRDTDRGILEIALDHGFSSHEAFTRAFRNSFGITPSAYRVRPVPVALRTILRPFDCYLTQYGGVTMKQTEQDVKIYFVTISSHKYLHIRNYESIGYWDFWQKQAEVPGQDCETICGLLDSIPGKLDDMGGNEQNAGSGQLMAWINAPAGRICSWGIPLAESYGVRLAADYAGPMPEQMQLMDVPEGEYIVFEHGPFDYATQGRSVEEKIEKAMAEFDWEESGYRLDTTDERVFYFYHDCQRFFKYVRPVRKA